MPFELSCGALLIGCSMGTPPPSPATPRPSCWPARTPRCMRPSTGLIRDALNRAEQGLRSGRLSRAGWAGQLQ